MDKKDLGTIRDLIGLMHDSALGFSVAGRYAQDPELKAFLKRESHSRAENALKLVGELRKNGISITLGGTLFGSTHRGWMAMQYQLFSPEDTNTLAECERGESYLIGRFDDVLGRVQLSHNMREFLEKQRQTLMTDYQASGHLDSQPPDLA